MKKTITIEILLLFVFGVLIAISIIFLQLAANQFIIAEQLTPVIETARKNLMYGLFLLIAAIADLVVIILIALKDFPKIKQSIAEHKAVRKTTKKQKRIDALQAELDALKKDE